MPKLDHRTLSFESVEAAAAEVERLASIDVRTTGQRSFGEIVEHLARTLDVVTGRVPIAPPPFFLRLVGPLIRPMILRKMSPGFKLPAAAQSVLWPDGPIPTDQAMDHFRSSLQSYQTMADLPRHAFFGNMTRAQHDRLQCNHCAMHLGFVYPAD